MFRSIRELGDDGALLDKVERQVQGAFQRAEDAGYHIRWARAEDVAANGGTMYWMVPSATHAGTWHKVYVAGRKWHCDCEACQYGKCFTCIHVATVVLRLRRAKKQGTRRRARIGQQLIAS